MAAPEPPNIHHHIVTQGRNKIEITTTTDTERGIERTELVMTKGKRVTHHVIERDLTTGKILPPEGMEPKASPYGLLLSDLAANMAERLKQDAKKS